MQDQANPYAPPKAAVSDAVANAGDFELASRLSRVGAALIDIAIVVAVVLPIVLSVGMDFTTLQSPDALASAAMGKAAVMTSLLSLVAIVITIILVKRNGQTIGKKLVGIKVVRSNGDKASLGRIFWLRNFVNALPSAIRSVGVFYQLVDHLFIFGEKHQCLHDKIADTVVVRA